MPSRLLPFRASLPMAEPLEALVVAEAIDAERQAIAVAVSTVIELSIEKPSVTWVADYNKRGKEIVKKSYLIGLVGFWIIYCCYYCYY